jgi:hypothetical protein
MLPRPLFGIARPKSARKKPNFFQTGLPGVDLGVLFTIIYETS